AGRSLWRDNGSALRLFRRRLPRLAAYRRDLDARGAVRAALPRSRSQPLRAVDGGERRQAGGAAGARPRLRPQPGGHREIPHAMKNGMVVVPEQPGWGFTFDAKGIAGFKV